MKLTVTPDINAAILRNDKSAIIGHYWYDTIDVEKIGNDRRKVSFFMFGKFIGYINVDEVEYKGSIMKKDEQEN